MKLPPLSRFTKIGMAAVAVLFLAWVGLNVFTSNQATRSAAVKQDETHCPNCGRELPKSAIAAGECPYCLIEQGPAKAKIRRRGDADPSSPVAPIILVSLFCCLLATHVVLLVRQRVVGRKEGEVFYLNCPQCGRRIRYRESQAGHLARCPLCRRPLVFPRPAAGPDKPWHRLRRWLKLAPR